jgi:nucleoside-triphosphatase THEP1
LLKARKIPVAGFIARGEWSGDARSGFDLIEVNEGERILFCSSYPTDGYVKAGRFYFNPLALDLGEQWLNEKPPGTLLIIDEIGRFELLDMFWSKALKEKLVDGKNPLLLTVRKQFLAGVLEHFSIKDTTVFELTETSNTVVQAILARLQNTV